MKTLITTIAAIALLSSTAVMAESAPEKAVAHIKENHTAFEVAHDLSQDCKIKVKVRGTRGISADSCQKLREMSPKMVALHNEAGRLAKKAAKALKARNKADLIGDSDMNLILETTSMINQTTENMNYITARISQ